MALQPDTTLQDNEAKRQALLSQLQIDGKFDEDPKMLNVALKALQDSDKVALGLKRLAAETEDAAENRRMARLIAMLNNGVKANPLMHARDVPEAVLAPAIPEPVGLPEFEPVFEETRIGISQMRITDFNEDEE